MMMQKWIMVVGFNAELELHRSQTIIGRRGLLRLQVSQERYSLGLVPPSLLAISLPRQFATRIGSKFPGGMTAE